MRQILFKAKRIDNGEWVEGYLIQSPYMGEVRSWISTPEDKTRLRAIATYYGDWRAVEVGTDTICQYTGLTDKNGNKIWENDIVNTKGKGCGFDKIEIVKYDKGGFSPFSVAGWECTPDAENVEVISNIFDSPELIGEQNG